MAGTSSAALRGARSPHLRRDRSLPVINNELDSVIIDALSEVGLPAQLADAAASDAYDGELRVSHDAAMAPMGSGVGTPIIHLGASAFFGPVMTGVPRGSEALKVFDGLRLLASYPRLFEIKRPLAGSLELEPAERLVRGVHDGSRAELAR